MPRKTADGSTISADHQVLQAIWRQAYANPKGLTIPCGTEAQATRMRFSLYNSVKYFRSGKYEPDEKLARAIDTLSISFTPDKCGLQLIPKVLSGMMPQLLAMLGGVVPKTVDELLLEEAAARIAKMAIEQVQEEPKVKTDAEIRAINYGARG